MGVMGEPLSTDTLWRAFDSDVKPTFPLLTPSIWFPSFAASHFSPAEKKDGRH